MKIDEAMAVGAAGPWRASELRIYDRTGWLIAEAGQSIGCGMNDMANMALVAHWHNVGPKLLEALREMDAYLHRIDPIAADFDADLVWAHNVIAEAEEVAGI